MNKKTEKKIRKHIRAVVEDYQRISSYKNSVNDYDSYDYPYEYYQDYFNRSAEDLQKNYDSLMSFEDAGRFVKEFVDKDGGIYTLNKIRGERKFINGKEIGFVFKLVKEEPVLKKIITFFIEFNIKFDFYLTQNGFEKQASEVEFVNFSTLVPQDKESLKAQEY